MPSVSPPLFYAFAQFRNDISKTAGVPVGNSNIVDAFGNTWGLVGNQVVVNGVVDPTTNRVTELAYVNGQVWQENTDNLW